MNQHDSFHICVIFQFIQAYLKVGVYVLSPIDITDAASRSVSAAVV